MFAYNRLRQASSAIRASVVLSMLLFALGAFAQFTSGIQGTILDPSGAAVPGAHVVLTNVATGVAQNSVSNGAGLYFFNRIAPGHYTVQVEANGFSQSQVEANVTTDQVAAVDVHLTVGQSSAMVTVTAESAAGLNNDETRLQYTLSSKEISQLPLQNRATLSLLRTAPGVTGVDENESNIQPNRSQPNISANGRPNTGNLFLLDNIPVNSELGSFDANGNGSFGAIAIVPNTDMIGEVALQTTTFSVENSASSSLQTSITTKSGANLFHGDADYTYTSRPFAAVGDFQSKDTSFRRQFVSGALGGPIIKNHLFFFGSYQNQRISAPSTGLVQDETDQFVAWAQQNYPNSQNVKMGMARFRPTRASNVTILDYGSDIDGANCDTPGYLPCALPAIQQGVLGASGAVNGTQYNFRLDNAFRDGRDKIYLSFFRFDQLSDSLSERPGFDGATPSTGYYIAGSHIHVFTPSLLNQASFGATRFAFNFTTTPHSRDQVTVPYLNLVGGSFPGITAKFLYTELEHDYYGRDVVSYVKDRHSFTFGFNGSYVNSLTDDSSVYGRPFLQLPFSGYQGFVHDQSDLELLYTLSAQTGLFVPQVYGAQTTRFGAYAQDAWKIRPNLLINLGVRWDDFGNPISYGNGAQPYANVFPGSGSSLAVQIANASSRLTEGVFGGRQNKNFLPRGSFAWSPTKANNLSIHGGIGLYEDDVNLSTVTSNLPTQPPVRLSLTLSSSGTGPHPIVSYGTSDNAPPYGFVFPTIPNAGQFTAKGGIPGTPTDLYGEDRGLSPQKTILYNFGLDQQLKGNLVFGLLYSGSHSYDQYVTTDLNTYNGRTISGDRPNTDFGQISLYRNAGWGNYNALIGTIRDQIGTLTLQGSYTWSHSLGTPLNYFTDQYNLNSQYANTAADIRNRLTISEVYEVPRLWHNSLLNQVLGGFNLSNVLIAQSGVPFTVGDANGYAAAADDFNEDGSKGIDIPNYNGTRHGGWSRTEYKQGVFGTSAAQVNSVFTAPTPGPGVEGNAGVNTFRGPGYFNLDSSLSKHFQMPWFGDEHSTMILRAEAINTLNRTNLLVTTGISQGALNTSTYQVGNSNTNVGQAQSAGQGRILQVGARFEF